MDNWWLDPITEEEKQNLVYIVGGFQIELEDGDQNKFGELNSKIDILTEHTNSKIDNVIKAIQNLES